MSLSMLSEFRTMGQVAEQTRDVLVRYASTHALNAKQRNHLHLTLEHLTSVREGFQLSLRRTRGNPQELRDIVRHTLTEIDWSFLEMLGLDLIQNNQIEPVNNQLVAFAHATVALTTLPMLPPREVSHPMSSNYRDLRQPRRPGEWLERIEELEAALTRLQLNMTRQGLSHPVWRRAHAYFDASAWLVRSHLIEFGAD